MDPTNTLARVAIGTSTQHLSDFRDGSGPTYGESAMDEQAIKTLRQCTEFADGGSGFVEVDCRELRELLDAYEALQRIAELPASWQVDAQQGGTLTRTVIESCADELQQALPEGMRK